MAIISIILVGIFSIGFCMVAAALIADPTLITDFLVALWELFGKPESPFFWMLTAPAIVMIILYFLYVAWLHIKRPLA